MHKVFFTGGDGVGWALDEDLKLTIRSAEGIVRSTGFGDAEIVHSAWWEGLRHINPVGKKVICHLTNPVFHYLKVPDFSYVTQKVTQWIARSSEAVRQFQSIGIDPMVIPYIVDTSVFKPIDAQRDLIGLPQDKYLIGNFHRDTEGGDLSSPKVQKGPDLFLEIVAQLVRKGLPIHVVLAGPRRFWLRNKLASRGIPFTFIGKPTRGDDLAANLLDRSTLNLLYNLIDIYVITSRWEGGPHSVMESAAARCKVISTRVGLAEDILEPESIFDSLDHGIELLKKDIESRELDRTKDPQEQKVKKNSPEAVKEAIRSVYDRIDSISPFSGIRGIRSRGLSSKICIWHKFVNPPWGGGNQFLLALRKEFVRRGITVVENCVEDDIDAYLVNSVQFDHQLFYNRKKPSRIVHRIDGPISMYRGTAESKELDKLCYKINAELAHTTIVQSAWTLQKIYNDGYSPINPIIIHNAVDSDIFNRNNKSSFMDSGKIRVISSSWSSNERKGASVHQWVNDNIDTNRYEYFFVGSTRAKLNNIVPPVPSEEVSRYLKSSDIYLMCSEIESCSNAVIEALACGLPVLHKGAGSTSELVSFAGLSFDLPEQIPDCLRRISENYEGFQNVIQIPSIKSVADKYIAALLG